MAERVLPRVTGTWGAVAVATPGTAVQLSTTDLWVTKLAFQPGKVTGANTGNVYLGGSDVDKTSNRCIQIANSVALTEFPTSGSLNLAELYVDADTAADGLRIYYEKGGVQ